MYKISTVAFFFFVTAILVFGTAYAQTGQDSVIVALKPCTIIIPTAIAGNTAINFKVRGTCNVPTTASAIIAQVTVSGSTSDSKGYLWTFSTLQPAIAQFHYLSGKETDTHALVALCDPEPECGTADLSLRVVASATVAVEVEGYLKAHP